MSLIKVFGSDGQVVEVEEDNLVFNDFTASPIEAMMPTEGHIVCVIAAANGLKRTALIPIGVWHDMVEDLEDTANSIHTHLQADIDGLEADLATINTTLSGKFNAPTGTISQYIRGNGTLATFPSAVDISGKSDKANFAVLSTLAAHGRSNGATNSPTDAPTNLNVVTTLLGGLTGEVNATNGRQNTIAANLNALATQFNALLIWLTTNQGSINNLRTAGAT